MNPTERWNESMKLFDAYVALGGSLDPEPDPQTPFLTRKSTALGTDHSAAPPGC